MLSLLKLIADKFDRAAGKVTINRTASGTIVFDGFGLPGRSVEIAKAAALTRTALLNTIDTIVLPVIITQPAITVTDPALTTMGIREVVSSGRVRIQRIAENRQHNIGVGIPQVQRSSDSAKLRFFPMQYWGLSAPRPAT